MPPARVRRQEQNLEGSSVLSKEKERKEEEEDLSEYTKGSEGETKQRASGGKRSI
jgi:hypothetical protein